MAIRDMVGRHVDRVGGNGHRAREQHLLPAGSGLSREGGRGKQGAAARPEIGHVGTRIGARLVESDAGYTPVHIRAGISPPAPPGYRVPHPPGQGPSCRARA